MSSILPPAPDSKTQSTRREAAHTAVQAAAAAYRLELTRLTYILDLARGYGLTTAELAADADLNETLVTALLGEEAGA